MVLGVVIVGLKKLRLLSKYSIYREDFYMKMIESMLLGSFLTMGLMFYTSAEVPTAPPSGLQDLGLVASIALGSINGEEWNVDKDFLLKKGERTGKAKDSFALHTNAREPWFIVTLKTPATLQSIYIQNAIGNCQERAKGLTISVSNDQKTWKEIWKASDVQSEWTIDLKTPEKAQYIKFELPRSADSYLHLNNVRIYGN